jgi:hypothetical protein
MSYNTKNYTEQGGEKTVIGGTLEIKEGASVTGITTATIVDALTSDDATKALSANQGKALKTAVDAKYTAANATTAAAGLVKQSVLVADAAGSAPSKAEFDALIAALKTAGIMAST